MLWLERLQRLSPSCIPKNLRFENYHLATGRKSTFCISHFAYHKILIAPAGLRSTTWQRNGDGRWDLDRFQNTVCALRVTSWNPGWGMPKTSWPMLLQQIAYLDIWKLRGSADNRTGRHQDVLCLIFDGYDKSKPVLPRWAHGQLPKNPTFERLSRTHVAVSAVLAHGHGCFIFLSEEGCVPGGTFSFILLKVFVGLFHHALHWSLQNEGSSVGKTISANIVVTAR